jgi:hypothetical protein
VFIPVCVCLCLSVGYHVWYSHLPLDVVGCLQRRLLPGTASLPDWSLQLHSIPLNVVPPTQMNFDPNPPPPPLVAVSIPQCVCAVCVCV